MPHESKRELPLEVKAMPTAARAVFRAAFRAAIKEKPEQMAAGIALAAVKKVFSRIENEEGEEEWVPKEEAAEAREAEIAEALRVKAGGDPNDPDDDPTAEEGEGGDEGEEGSDPKRKKKKEEEDDPDFERASNVIKAARAIQVAAGGGEGASADGLEDSVELTDVMTLDAAGFRLTEDGFLVANPRVARTGIQLYRGSEVGRPDMEEVRVYRPEEEVFNTAAMSSLAHRPITLDHPDTKVDASNWRKLGVGKSEGDVARDGDFIRVPLMLMDAAAITAAQSGKSQLSVGYGAKLVWGSGLTLDGEPYDAKQTEIRANHIALVSAARGGDKLKIGDAGMDDLFDREFSANERKAAAAKGQAMPGGGFPIKSEQDLKNAIQAIGRAKNPAAAKAHIKKRAKALGLTNLLPASWGDSEGDHEDGQQRSSAMTERTVNLDGVSIALESKDSQILDRHLAGLNEKIRDQDDALSSLKKKLEAAVSDSKKAIDTKDGEIAVLNKKIEDGKVTPQMLDEFCRKRMDVVGRAVRVLGDAYAFDNKSDAQIRRDVVVAEMGDASAKEMSDENILGAFNYITKSDQQDGVTRVKQSFSGQPARGINDSAAKAYDKRNADLATAYKKNKRAFGAAVA